MIALDRATALRDPVVRIKGEAMTTAGGGFHGIYPMLYAFFGADGALDRAAMRRQVEHCVAAGAHGLAALGLATEVEKLTPEERRQILAWVAEDLAGRVPLAITVFGNSVEEQRAFADEAERAGADWLILQPPRIEGLPEAELIDFFGQVMAQARLPMAIQNAPEYIGIGLSAEGIERLRRSQDNFTVLKGEGPAVTIRAVIEATSGALAVFNGRNGLELPDNLRAGCAGIIPTPETCAAQVRIFELMRSGAPEDEAEAERLYREILPLLTFVMQSVPHLICYGKRIAAWRLGLERVHDRAPCLAPSDFGLDCAGRYADGLGGRAD